MKDKEKIKTDPKKELQRLKLLKNRISALKSRTKEGIRKKRFQDSVEKVVVFATRCAKKLTPEQRNQMAKRFGKIGNFSSEEKFIRMLSYRTAGF